MPIDEVAEVIRGYFDALFHGDVAGFRRLFHPACRLWTTDGTTVTSFDYEPYMVRVAGRPSAASRGDRRADEIVSIRVSSATTASATVRDCYLPARFTNELSLLKVAGEWRIVAKVWHLERG